MLQRGETSSIQTAVVESDVLCRGCGYNLRTLNTGGICPECGAGVSASLRRGPFDDAPSRWMLIVAVGLALLTASFIPPIVGVLVWLRHDREICLIETGLAGPKLWIMIRMLQMGVDLPVDLSNLLSLLLQVAGVTALTWRVRDQGKASRRMGLVLRSLLVIGMLYWLAFGLKWLPAAVRFNDIQSGGLLLATMLDVSCIVLTGFIIAGISRRGGYKRAAKWILVTTIVQAGGLSFLFSGIYIMNNVNHVLWLSLLTHAAGGVALTITGIWLMIKLLRGVQRVRAIVHVKDGQIQSG